MLFPGVAIDAAIAAGAHAVAREPASAICAAVAADDMALPTIRLLTY
jgi:hypothetical protein